MAGPMRHPRGFTLIEMVMVIVLVGIVAGILAPFIKQSIDAYVDTQSRSELVARGRLALQRINREVRQAIPNSMEEVVDGTGNPGIQFATSLYGGRYVAVDDDFGSAFTVPSRRFIKNQNRTQLYVVGTALTTGANSALLVIDNPSPAELKAGTTVTSLTSINALNPPADGTSQGRILQYAVHSFPHDSPGRHYQLVDATHEIGLVGNALHWRRADNLTGYNNSGDWTAADPILVDGVNSVSFSYNPGTPESSGVLRIDLELTEDTETIRLYHEIHIRNTP